MGLGENCYICNQIIDNKLSMRRFLLITMALCVATTVLVAQPKVIAHRGYWKAEGCAQNSISSLRAAGELGCWGSEFDVWMTADGHLILYHDDEFEGRRVEELTLEEMRLHRLENGEELPLLEEFLRVAQEYPDLHLVFELKAHNNKEQERKAVRASVAMIEAMGLAERTDYICFSKDACVEFATAAPQAKVFFLSLTGALSAEEIKDANLAGASYFHLFYRLFPRFIDRLHERGLEAGVWTVNNKGAMRWMMKHSLDYITTDRPDVALSLTGIKKDTQD